MKKILNQKHISYCIGIFLIGLLALSGCKDKESSAKEIRFWAMGIEGEKVTVLAKKFEKENPGIKVVVQQVPWTAAHEKLITAFASNTLPDVFQLGNTWLPEFNALGAIEPLDDFIKESALINDTIFFEGIWETNVLGETIYGIPWYVDTRLLFYRKSILNQVGYNQPPKTWEELYDVSRKIVEFYNYKKYALFLPTNEWVPFILFGIQANSKLLKNDFGNGDFSGAEFKKSFTYLTKFYKEKLSPIDMTAVNNIYQAFTENYFSILITGPWNITEMKNRLPKEIANDWGTAPMPSPDSIYPGYSLAGGASLVINKASKMKKEGWKFIEFLTRETSQLEFFQLVSALPSVKSVWKDSVISSNRYLDAFFSQLQKVKSTPKIPEWEQIVFSKIQQYAEYTAAGKMDINTALKNLDKDVDIILEKRRWFNENNY